MTRSPSTSPPPGPRSTTTTRASRLFIDAGRQTAQIVLDINGTPGNPDDDEFVEFIPGDLTGRFDTEGRDFCADVMEFIG